MTQLGLASSVIIAAGLAVACTSSGSYHQTMVDIRGHNMEHTLQSGHDYAFTDVSGGYRVESGDIIEFRAPAEWASAPKEEFVQRVIATGGETIRGVGANLVQVSTDGGKTYRTLQEPYVFRDFADDAAHFGPVTVPAGRLWVMGDHRNESADSRYHCSSTVELPDPSRYCDPDESTVPVSDVVAYRRR